MFDFHIVKTGDGEPVSCSLCASGNGHAATVSDVRDVIDDLRAVVEHAGVGVVENVMFAGGEPLAIEGIGLAVDAARELGARRIGIRTTAAGLAGRPDVALPLVRAGLRHVHVVATGVAGSPAGHGADPIEGGTLQGIAALRQAAADAGVRLALCGRAPVCSHNLEALPQVVRQFAESGAEAVVLLVDPLLDPRRAAPWVCAAFETGLVNAVWVAVDGIPEHLLGAAAAATRGSIRFVREVA